MLVKYLYNGAEDTAHILIDANLVKRYEYHMMDNKNTNRSSMQIDDDISAHTHKKGSLIKISKFSKNTYINSKIIGSFKTLLERRKGDADSGVVKAKFQAGERHITILEIDNENVPIMYTKKDDTFYIFAAIRSHKLGRYLMVNVRNKLFEEVI